MNPKIVVAWALVGIPLAYGIIETLRRAAQLFTG
ncbi:MFS transporter small subunit [Nocardioides luteus]